MIKISNSNFVSISKFCIDWVYLKSNVSIIANDNISNTFYIFLNVLFSLHRFANTANHIFFSSPVQFPYIISKY